MAKDLSSNPSRAYEKAYIDTLVKKGYNEDQLKDFALGIENPGREKQTDENGIPVDQPKTIAQGLGFGGNGDPLVPIVDWVNDFAGKTVNSAATGLEKANEGVAEVLITGKGPGEIGHGVLKATTGTAQAAFNSIPAAIAFNAATDVINTAAEKNLSPENAKSVQELTSLPFTIATKTASALGIKPEEGSSGQMVMELMDLAIAAGAMHSVSTGKFPLAEKIQSAKDLQDITKKALEGKLSTEETTQLKDYTKALASTNITDLKEAAEKSDRPESKEVLNKIDEMESKNVPNNDLHNKLAELQAKSNDDSFGSLPQEAQDGILNDIKTTQDEIAQKDHDVLDSHIQDADATAKVADLDDKIGQLTDSMADQPVSVKDSIQKTIANLKMQRDSFSGRKNLVEEKSVSDLMNMDSAALKEYSKILKNKMSADELVAFGESGAKKYRDAQRVLNSRISSDSEIAEARSVIKNLESGLSQEQKARIFNGQDPSEISQMANRVEVVEQAENMQDLVGATKVPLLDYAQNSNGKVAKVVLDAVRKKAAELGISPADVLKHSLDNIASELPDGTDAEFLKNNILDSVFKSSETNSQNDPQKQRVIDFKIQEAIDAGEIEKGSVQETLARESLAKKYDNAVELEKDSMAMYKAEEGDMAEAFTEPPSEKDGQFTYRTSKNEYSVTPGKGELTILDKEGHEPSANTRLNIVKDYEDKFDYSKGKSAFEGVKEGDILPEEADKLIAEKSENPAEIIDAHERLMDEAPFIQGDAVDNAIAENIGKIKQKGRGGYNNFGDKNNVTSSKARAYFNEGKGEQIDTLAQRISEDSGINVTPDDIISFIDRHPNGISDYTKGLKNPLVTLLKDRFKAITGLTLNDRVLRAYDKKNLPKAEYDLLNQDFENYEQARKSFKEAIDRGEIAEPILPTEEAVASEVESGETSKAKVTAPPPEVKTSDTENPPPSKKLKLGERIIDSTEISSEIKAGLKEKGIDYIPVDLELTQTQAKDYVKAFVEADELDKAISNVTDMSNGMKGVVRGAIGKELFEVMADKAKAAETIEEQKKWSDKAVDIARFTAENFKAAGQEINAAKAWKRMLQRTPEGAIASIKKGVSEKNENTLKGHKEEIASAKEIIDEFLKSEDFNKLVGEKIKGEIDKLSKRSPKKENIFNSKKVRDERLADLRERAKKAKDSGASSSIIGLNKEQIEIYGEMGVIYLIEGAYKFKTWANKMKKENPHFTEAQMEGLWGKAKVSKEYDPQQRTLADFAKTGVFEMMPPEVKREFLNKWENKLKKLSPESRKKLLGNAFDEIQKLGGLSNERFKEMYAEELGLPGVDKIAEQKIRGLIDVINKSDKSAKELQDALDNNADKKEIAAKQKQWVDDVFNGQRANAELSDYFKDDKTIGSTLSTILQGNLLGPLSLVKNIYSNTLIQPLRALSRGIGSSADFVLSKAAMFPLMDKVVKQGRTMDALAYWKGESKGVMPGLKTSVKELIHGINPEQMIERDLSQQLQPLKSMADLIAGLKGEKKVSAYQQVNNFTEATFGVPAEIMFRLLNLGDKPFRKAAEFGAAYEIGKLKGLEGKDLDKFVLFPDAASAELIKQRSERAVYQQAEGLAKKAQQGLKGVEDYLADLPYIGDAAKVIFKSQIPYVKTPLNILGETLEYTFPEYTTAKAIYHALKGERRQAVEYFGKAVTGAGIRFAVKQMVSSGLVTGSNDRKDVEGSDIQYQNVPPNSLNITGLQRMMHGGSPKIQDNDVWVNYNNMGVVGMLIGVHANQKNINDTGYFEGLTSDMSYTAKSAIEQSFLAGANTFLEAVTGDDRSKRKWAINSLGALGSIVYPNTLANISKAMDDTSRATKADTFSEELSNTFKTKMFAGHQLPSKVNLWGESIHQVPEGKSKYTWYLLDVTKGKPVDTESFNYKIYDLWNKLPDDQKGNALPHIPRNYLTVKKQKVMLSPSLYETYQKYTGKNRANLVEKYTKSPNWKEDSDEKKLDKLKKIYETGAASAKKQLLNEHPELSVKK